MLDANVGGYLSQAFKSGTAAHAYIVVGEKPMLPALLAQCAQVVMCTSRTACGSCVQCSKTRQGIHQDVISVPTDVAKNRLTVADVSYLVDEANKRPVDNGQNRVFLVNAADSASGQGCEIWQNKLLKTLEEPAAGVYIFIGVADAESLLPTVRSRCQALKQSKLSVAEVQVKLEQRGFEAQACQMVAAMSGGSFSAAERLMSNPHVFTAYNLALDVAVNMTSTKNALTYASQILAVKDYVTDFLGFFTALLRESIVYRLAESLCILPLFKDSIDKICANYTLSAAEDCIERLALANKQLANNASLSVAVDSLLVDVLQIRYQRRD